MAKKGFSNSETLDIAPNNFIEISIDPTILNNFSNEDGLANYLNQYSFSEEFQTLKLELYQEILLIIETNLTERQRKVIKMTYIDGKKQCEIAVFLGIDQSAISKTINGNIDYNKEKRYGGALKKMQKLCATNKKIKEILEKMRQSYKYFNSEE